MAFSYRSSFLSIVATLVATLMIPFNFNDGSINHNIITFANGQIQDIENRWSISFNESATTLDENRTFTFFYDVNTAMAEDNAIGRVFDEGCMEGGNELNTTELGIENITTSLIAGTGDATFSFGLNIEALGKNSDITTNLPDGKGQMNLCSRFGLQLQTPEGVYEVNFLENIITIDFTMTGDFQVNFTVRPKDTTFEESALEYTVDGYLCDPSNPGVPLNQNVPFLPGSVLSVCVTPTAEAIADGLFMRSIDSFKWFRGATEQYAVQDGVQAGNSLSILICTPGTLFCTISSVLYAAFFQPTQSPTAVPVEIEEPEPTGGEGGGGSGGPVCEGLNKNVTELMYLNFTEANVTENTLGPEGELRFSNIATIPSSEPDTFDTEVDLVITTDYANSNLSITGKDSSGNFGIIYVATELRDWDAGKATFEFCLVDSITSEPIIDPPPFQWSVVDFDLPSYGDTELLTIDTTKQTVGYSLYPRLAASDIYNVCETDLNITEREEKFRDQIHNTQCSNDEHLSIFKPTRSGWANDITDIESMDERQLKKSIVFHFTQRSCWTFDWQVYCAREAYPNGTSTNLTCPSYGDKPLMFGGGIPVLVENGTTACTHDYNSYTFPATSIESDGNFIHGLCILGAERDMVYGTSDYEGMYYSASENFTVGDEMWVDRKKSRYNNYNVAQNITGGESNCEGGVYLKPWKSSDIPWNTTITIDWSTYEPSVTVCAMVGKCTGTCNVCNGTCDGGWPAELEADGFVKADDDIPFQFNDPDGDTNTTLESYCRVFTPTPRPTPSPTHEYEPSQDPSEYPSYEPSGMPVETTTRFLEEEEEERRRLDMVDDEHDDEQRDLQGALTISGAGTATLQFPTRRNRRRSLSFDEDGRALQQQDDGGGAAGEAETQEAEIPEISAGLLPLSDDLISLQTAGANNISCLSSSCFFTVLIIGVVVGFATIHLS